MNKNSVKGGSPLSWKTALSFTKELLQTLHLSHCTVKNPQDHIPTAIDLGLRELLFGEENYRLLLQNSMGEAAPNTIYRFFDEYGCNYLFFQLPQTGEYFFIGPYLTQPPCPQALTAKGEELGLDQGLQERMEQYYAKLPILEDETTLFAITTTLGRRLWGNADAFTMEYVTYAIPDRTRPLPVTTEENDPSPVTLALLEEQYQKESNLMKAVSEGKLHKINGISTAAYMGGATPRISDSLRNRKNYLIILNTLLRKAAGQGGVHPLHLHRTSSVFAKKIESVASLQESLGLQSQMMREYCLLVKKHSLHPYSPLVGKVITLISYDLTADLSLKNLAAGLSVNPTYLSSLFSKEMGCTLTGYVNRKRMEKAVSLLQTTKLPVNQIAFECGISDTNYFIKLFKKFAGTTPTDYRRTAKS